MSSGGRRSVTSQAAASVAAAAASKRPEQEAGAVVDAAGAVVDAADAAAQCMDVEAAAVDSGAVAAAPWAALAAVLAVLAVLHVLHVVVVQVLHVAVGWCQALALATRRRCPLGRRVRMQQQAQRLMSRPRYLQLGCLMRPALPPLHSALEVAVAAVHLAAQMHHMMALLQLAGKSHGSVKEDANALVRGSVALVLAVAWLLGPPLRRRQRRQRRAAARRAAAELAEVQRAELADAQQWWELAEVQRAELVGAQGWWGQQMSEEQRPQ